MSDRRQTIRLGAAASPRLVATEYPRRRRDGAATRLREKCLHGINTSVFCHESTTSRRKRAIIVAAGNQGRRRYWRWATDASFARWSFEALVLNQMAGEGGDDDAGAAHWLDYWSFAGKSKLAAFGVFVAWAVVFHLLALAAMKWCSFQKT